MEEWKECCEGYYEVSNQGRVRRINGGRGAIPGRILRPYITTTGYSRFGLSVRNKQRIRDVHILVAEAFIGPRPAGLDINHKDGNPANNTPENLEYVTRQQNLHHAYRIGLTKVKIPQSTVDEIRRLRKTGLTYLACGKATGTSEGYCWHVVNGYSRVIDWTKPA